MKIQLIRNATMKITYAGKLFLTDPMLESPGNIRSFAGKIKNPTTDLPLSVNHIITGLDGVVVSHLHPDHFDTAASRILPGNLPLFCQPEDENAITAQGFNSVTPVNTTCTWDEITITRTPGSHGSGEILDYLGNVSGFIFQAKGEPTVYWAGDTILCDHVFNTIETFKPDIIITHSGGATLPGYDPIIMDDTQTLETINAAPESIIMAIHMEALDHCTISRDKLRNMANKEGIPESRLIIPENGETVVL